MRIYLPCTLVDEYLATGKWRIIYLTGERIAGAEHPIVRPQGAILQRVGVA